MEWVSSFTIRKEGKVTPKLTDEYASPYAPASVEVLTEVFLYAGAVSSDTCEQHQHESIGETSADEHAIEMNIA